MTRAVGFHGTSSATADRVISKKEKLKAKKNPGDWLGYGVYFWQDGPTRALAWAEGKYKAKAAVLRAQIDLADCLDLLDLVGFAELLEVQHAFEQIEKELGVRYVQRPLQISRGAARFPKGADQNTFVHDRDQAIVEFALPLIEKNRGRLITSIRAAFVDGMALHTSSHLFNWAQVQICVRENSVDRVISDITRFK